MHCTSKGSGHDRERALDDDLAFEMLTALRNAGAAADAWALLAELRAAWPELYQARQLPALAAALAQWADADLDTFSIERDRLAYHGHLALVADMMRQAWPLVRDVEAGLFGDDERTQPVAARSAGAASTWRPCCWPGSMSPSYF